MHSTRRAVVEISTPVLRHVLGPLNDHGVEVINSEHSNRYGIVRLVVAGDALPAECEAAVDMSLARLPIVTITLTEERYGAQRLVRVASIDLVVRGEGGANPCGPSS